MNISTSYETPLPADLNHELQRLSTKLEDTYDKQRENARSWALAENTYRSAKAVARLKAKADNAKATIPELDALVDLACAKEREAAYIYRAIKESDIELLRSLRAQMSALQSIAASVRSEMELAQGPQPRW